jgi:hypothetical protein
MSPDQLFVVETTKWLVILLCVLALAGTAVGVVAFYKTTKGAATTFSKLIQRGSIIRLTAIMAIIWAVFALGSIGKLDAPAASILSGIAGFVLGRGRSGSARPEKGEEPFKSK